MKSVAAQVNALGRFDAVIHNVAVGTREARVMSADGITEIFAVNVVAPYVLTALIAPPKRLIYLSSDMHAGGDDEELRDPQWETRPWNGSQAYSDTKLYDLILSMFIARRWPGVLVNAVNPGWVPTRMGGKNAPDDLREGATTQAWLAVSDDPSAMVSGSYFYHQKMRRFKSSAAEPVVQDRVIAYLQRLTRITIPLQS
jgi:NAD(P)-dependent dehydrogenase (short-subunit alcohol dehydrogenase family)